MLLFVFTLLRKKANVVCQVLSCEIMFASTQEISVEKDSFRKFDIKEKGRRVTKKLEKYAIRFEASRTHRSKELRVKVERWFRNFDCGRVKNSGKLHRGRFS